MRYDHPKLCTVLVVEDEALIAAMAEDVLTDAGYKIAIASDGDKALKVAQQVQPDVVVLDWRIPGTAGVNLMRALRAQLPRVSFIIATGCSLDRADLAAIVAANCGSTVPLLAKPFDLKNFRELVAEVLAQRQPPGGWPLERLGAEAIAAISAASRLGGGLDAH